MNYASYYLALYMVLSHRNFPAGIFGTAEYDHTFALLPDNFCFLIWNPLE